MFLTNFLKCLCFVMYSFGFLRTTLASIGVFTQSNNLVNKKRSEAA